MTLLWAVQPWHVIKSTRIGCAHLAQEPATTDSTRAMGSNQQNRYHREVTQQLHLA